MRQRSHSDRRHERRLAIRHERRLDRDQLRRFDFDQREQDLDVYREDPRFLRVNREAAIVPASVDLESRTIRAILSTDYAVRIYDWGTDTEVDEVLIPSGMKPFADHTPLLERHDRFQLRSVLGSIDQLTKSGTVEGRLRFTAAADVEPIWTRVAEGHLRNLSVGAVYTRTDYVEIAPGKSRSLGGVDYIALDVAKRLVKRWYLVEGSIVVFGADPNAKTRQVQKHQRNSTSKSQHPRSRF